MVSTDSIGAELCSNRAVATVDVWFMVVDQAQTTFDDSQELQQKMFNIKKCDMLVNCTLQSL